MSLTKKVKASSKELFAKQNKDNNLWKEIQNLVHGATVFKNAYISYQENHFSTHFKETLSRFLNIYKRLSSVSKKNIPHDVHQSINEISDLVHQINTVEYNRLFMPVSYHDLYREFFKLIDRLNTSMTNHRDCLSAITLSNSAFSEPNNLTETYIKDTEVDLLKSLNEDLPHLEPTFFFEFMLSLGKEKESLIVECLGYETLLKFSACKKYLPRYISSFCDIQDFKAMLEHSHSKTLLNSLLEMDKPTSDSQRTRMVFGCFYIELSEEKQRLLFDAVENMVLNGNTRYDALRFEMCHLEVTPIERYIEHVTKRLANLKVKGDTDLITTVKQHNPEFFLLLINAVKDIDEVNPSGNTALLTATHLKNLEFAKILIDAGASVDKQNLQGETARTLVKQYAKTHDRFYSDLSDYIVKKSGKQKPNIEDDTNVQKYQSNFFHHASSDTYECDEDINHHLRGTSRKPIISMV